jgi:hypothetical protein
MSSIYTVVSLNVAQGIYYTGHAIEMRCKEHVRHMHIFQLDKLALSEDVIPTSRIPQSSLKLQGTWVT